MAGLRLPPSDPRAAARHGVGECAVVVRNPAPAPAPAPGADEKILVVERLSLAFGSNRVLRGIDLTVRRGETFALLGGSGSGKTVLLRAVLGLERPDAGRILLFGRDVSALAEPEWEQLRKRISVVFQGGALYGALTVADNVALVLRELLHLPEPEVRRRVDEALFSVGLGDIDRDLVPGALSGGMKKRLAVARAIAPDPELLLYDEPTSGLDPFNSALVLALIRRLQEERGVTSLVVTHDVQGAAAIADRVGVLVGGVLEFVGTPSEFLASKAPAVQPFLRSSADAARLAAEVPPRAVRGLEASADRA
jgi:phospholipid/cholesterol/gamma-HCH transport system ATP-binding protein